MDSWIRGFVDSWIRGFVDSWIRGFVDSWIRGFALLAMGCLLPRLALAGIAESEPNNTMAAANTISWDTPNFAGVSVARINPRTDADFYRITTPTLPTGTRMSVVMTPTSPDQALDARLTILSSTGAQLLDKDSSGDNRWESGEIPVGSFQTYFIQCRSADWSSSGSGEYTVDISLFVPPTISRAYWQVPNQTLTCFHGTQVGLYAELLGFNVGNPVIFRLYEADAFSNDPVGERTTTVQSINGQLFASVTWSAAWQPDGVGDPEFYFTVEGRAAVGQSAELTVTREDPNDKLATAEPLGAVIQSLSLSGAISIPDDVNLYSFQAKSGQRITFDMDRPTGSLKPLLRLFDANGNELKRNSGGSNPVEPPVNEAFLEHAFTGQGTYFVGVSGLGNDGYDPKTGSKDAVGSIGSYKLTLSPGLAGQIRKDPSGTNHLVDLLRVDDPGAPIEGTKTTWVLVHGWNSSRGSANIAELAQALRKSRPADQVLTLA